jgi:hypothetical protein
MTAEEIQQVAVAVCDEMERRHETKMAPIIAAQQKASAVLAEAIKRDFGPGGKYGGRIGGFRTPEEIAAATPMENRPQAG